MTKEILAHPEFEDLLSFSVSFFLFFFFFKIFFIMTQDATLREVPTLIVPAAAAQLAAARQRQVR